MERSASDGRTMKRLATNSPPLAKSNNDEHHVGEGIKKATKAQSFPSGHYVDNNQTSVDTSFSQSSAAIFEAALKIARNRRETLDKIKDAFSRNDKAEVLRLTKELCGTKDDQEMHRTDSRVH